MGPPLLDSDNLMAGLGDWHCAYGDNDVLPQVSSAKQPRFALDLLTSRGTTELTKQQLYTYIYIYIYIYESTDLLR